MTSDLLVREDNCVYLYIPSFGEIAHQYRSKMVSGLHLGMNLRAFSGLCDAYLMLMRTKK